MAASTAWRTHLNTCPTCLDGQHCETGAPLYAQFVRLQDAYLAQQKRKG
ncbi:hypothetical protein ACFU5Z_08065 [Streptomyces sp. NPDC057521]